MSHLKTLAALTKPTSSQESEDGAELLDLLAGQMIDQYGREAAHANLSARQAKAKGLLTSGTYGLPGIGSFESRALRWFLESKLVPELAWRGSTLFRLTWKRKTTPAGRWFYQLVASALPTSGSDSGGWPTPMAGSPARNGYNEAGNNDSSRKTVNLCPWPTPRASDATGGVEPDGKTGRKLATICAKVGPPSNGSNAPTANKGRLNPEFSRWLMGYPEGWGSCGATAMQSFQKSRRK